MARLNYDEGLLQVDAERIDTDVLCVNNPVDEDKLGFSAAVDEMDLITDIGSGTSVPRYRADTTILLADNGSVTADYSY